MVIGLKETSKGTLPLSEKDLENEKNRILPQVLDLLDTAAQGSLEVLRLYAEEKPSEASDMLNNLSSVVAAVRTALKPIEKALEHSYMEEMLDNLDDTIQDIQNNVQAGQMDRTFILLEFQLFPFFTHIREQIYFWGLVYPDKQKMDDYYANEFAEHYRNPYILEEEPAKFQVSVVVPAFNHLDTTKQCVQSILKCTDFEALNAELILIDHGSTDGTLEYFNSIKANKVIHYKRNIRGTMFCNIPRICEGEFIAYVSNDIIVTKNWLNILLECIQSDPKIFSASPASPNVANLQMLNVPAKTPSSFVSWANKNNSPNSKLWNDRARVLPNIILYRNILVNHVGFWDPYFYLLEFSDDDLSLRARRAGYRQIICDDVSCYHFGSVTLKGAQIKEGSLEQSRKFFFQKHLIDAWDAGFCYDYNLVNLLMRPKFPVHPEAYSILGIDSGFGDSPLQVKNILRHKNLKASIYNITFQKQFLPDLEPLSDNLKLVDSIRYYPEALQAYEDDFFDFAIFSQDISQYPIYIELLKVLCSKLRPNGTLTFKFANPFFALTLNSFFNLDSTKLKTQLLFPEQLKNDLQTLFQSITLLPMKESVNGIEKFADRIYGHTSNKKQIIDILSTSMYYVLCQK